MKPVELSLLVPDTPYLIKRHVSHLFNKLGAANRTQAVTRARELRLLR